MTVLHKDSMFFKQPLPEFTVVDKFIGWTGGRISAVYPNHKIMRYSEGVCMVEIRMEHSTVACVVENNVCTRAYEFGNEER